MNTYAATYNGQTITRKSNKRFTHVSVVRWSDGSSNIASFHTTETAALKGVLTGQQKARGAVVIAVLPVTVI